MRRIVRLFVLTAGFASALAGGAAASATLRVAAGAPDVLATDGTCSLREAIINTNDDAATWPDCRAGSGPDTIVLSAGTYVLAIPGTEEDAGLTGDLDITGALALFGGSADQTVIDGAGLDTVMHVADGAVVDIRGITVTGGSPSGILNEGNLTLSAVVVSESLFPVFAGIYNLVGDLTVEASTISGGLSGIVAEGEEYISCRYSCTCHGCGENAPVRLVNTTVTGAYFAGISDIWQIFNPSCGCEGPVTLVGSTLAGNVFSISVAGPVFTAGTIFANSCYSPALSSEGHNLASDGTCNLTDPTDLPGTDPMLGPLLDNGGPTPTHALLPGSPAINAIPLGGCTYDHDGDPGTPEVPLTEDQRGVARPQGDGCDIGAYEVTACADGIDDDGDGLFDFPEDPGCRDAASVREDPQCQDGINNDPAQDDLIDFDGGLSALGYAATEPDPQCVGKPWQDREKTGSNVCGLGAELAVLLLPLMWLYGRSRPEPDAGERIGAGKLSKGKEGAMAWKLAQASFLGVALSMAIGVAGPIQASDCDPSQADLDLDGVADPCDNCPPSLCAEPLDCANPVVGGFDPTTMTTTGGQLDSDGDGLGDVCDLDLPPWEVSAGNRQVSCPECPLECAGLGCPGSPAAHYPVGVVSHLGLVRACDTSVPGFADGEVTPGCHRVCDLDGDPATPDEWCRKLDVTVWYPATGGTPVGPSYSVCETGGTKDSCEALGCVWSNDYFPGYFGGPLDLRCIAAEAAVNAPLVSAASDRPLPVLFLSHGSPAGPRDHGHLAAKLAESGYVVVSVSHPGSQWFNFGSALGYPFSEGSSYQGLFAWVHSFMPEIPLLEQNPYCNAATAAIVQQYAPGWGYPNADNFSGFATKEECFANSCGGWDDATGCDADPGTLFGPPAMLLRRERGRDISDVMTYFFGGELFDAQGLRSTLPPGGGWNQCGQWPWADAWDSRTGVLDPGRIGVIGYSFGGLTAITLTSKATYSGYEPAGTPDWDQQRFRDERIRAALLWAPGTLWGVPRVVMPLAVPTMIQSGVYDFMVPWSDDLPGLWDCVPPDVSGTGAEDPLCSIEGLFAAAQFDAPELEAQGLVIEPAEPPRFLTRLDTAGHVTFSDEEVAAFQISCPADPTQPCHCLGAATEASLGVAECTQLAGDRAKAEEILLDNAVSFLNAFVAGNPSGWTALEGDQYASGEVAGFLTADWDRDAPACGVSPLLGDGVLDSLDPEPLVCNLPGTPVDVYIDIRPWSELNAIHPFSRGLVTVALLGSDTFDVADVDVTTLAFGPDGAPPAFDLTKPLVYWLSHWDVDGDGRRDLLSSHRTAETGIAVGDTEACLTGETFDGVSFRGCDAVTTVMPPWGCGLGAELALVLPLLIWLRGRARSD